jgi:hypothetical protein
LLDEATWKDGKSKADQIQGAEWEEVEFTTVYEEEPTLQVANVQGDVFLPQGPIKLLVNNPALFGTFKVGDVIDFMPKTIAEPEITQKDN